MTRIVCVSDTHTAEPELPHGDVLIHAGDFSYTGDDNEIAAFNKWMERLPFKHKIVIAGNHELSFEKRFVSENRSVIPSVTYLQDEAILIGTELGPLSIYGTPWTPFFNDWAFNLPRDEIELDKKFSLIPERIDILISHGPPYGILDEIEDDDRDIHQGSKALLTRIQRVKPKLVVFGHIHDRNGTFISQGTTYVNASIMTEDYKPTQKPIVVDL